MTSIKTDDSRYLALLESNLDPWLGHINQDQAVIPPKYSVGANLSARQPLTAYHKNSSGVWRAKNQQSVSVKNPQQEHNMDVP